MPGFGFVTESLSNLVEATVMPSDLASFISTILLESISAIYLPIYSKYRQLLMANLVNHYLLYGLYVITLLY